MLHGIVVAALVGAVVVGAVFVVGASVVVGVNVVVGAAIVVGAVEVVGAAVVTVVVVCGQVVPLPFGSRHPHSTQYCALTLHPQQSPPS